MKKTLINSFFAQWVVIGLVGFVWLAPAAMAEGKPDPKKKQEQVGAFLKYDMTDTSEEKTIEWKGRSLNVMTVDATDAQGKPTMVTISMEAPPLCIVKLNSPETTMELLEWGTGANTKIVGKPVGMWRWVWGLVVDAAMEPSK